MRYRVRDLVSHVETLVGLEIEAEDDRDALSQLAAAVMQAVQVEIEREPWRCPRCDSPLGVDDEGRRCLGCDAEVEWLVVE